jgi:hypothetical protein
MIVKAAEELLQPLAR